MNTSWQEQGGGFKKERLNVAKPGVKTGALMPLHTVCGMGTILFVACAPATNRAFLHPTSAPDMLCHLSMANSKFNKKKEKVLEIKIFGTRPL
ncbi:MAG: hypothetical protein MR449_01365 [Spirochaetia bacterium]|nr:hypothetical protein [Spirochaetia bacterium]